MRDAEAEAYLDRFEQSGGPLLSALRSALEPAALVRVLGGPGCALWGGQAGASQSLSPRSRTRSGTISTRWLTVAPAKRPSGTPPRHAGRATRVESSGPRSGTASRAPKPQSGASPG